MTAEQAETQPRVVVPIEEKNIWVRPYKTLQQNSWNASINWKYL
jgi:hypothetical protein